MNVDTQKAYLRHRDGRVLPLGAMNPLEDGWGVRVPATMMDNRHVDPIEAREEAYDSYRRWPANAWQSGLPNARPQGDAAALEDGREAVDAAWDQMVKDMSEAGR